NHEYSIFFPCQSSLCECPRKYNNLYFRLPVIQSNKCHFLVIFFGKNFPNIRNNATNTNKPFCMTLFSKSRNGRKCIPKKFTKFRKRMFGNKQTQQIPLPCEHLTFCCSRNIPKGK